ncbi:MULTISPECIES: SigE family RNA polymerase sigma factor [Streptomyces]|uniref:SigE family RNA polymerase sigma factor n=2 Tax=Streptomyces TaxID=1883 RepID=UPI001D0B445B|nr:MULTISPECIES: SigE family RNA polymerase sigma factor [Streptomyces]MCX5080947.1 SigE family RNA polymerase sigma factor [Streptomyces sp. NBC_00401]UDL99157.1 SigE family RNA polymerase sigma factor [Streptomyces longhuiensis]
MTMDAGTEAPAGHAGQTAGEAGADRWDSFREFVASRSSALLKTAVLLSGGDRHAAEDLLQNALIKAAGRWHRIDEPEAYVRKILYRQQISRWRLKWRGRELTVAEPPESRTGVDSSHAADLRIVMRTALARLTARQRTVLVLRYFEDLPEADVARLLGCSVGTVRSTTHRSLAKLRSLAPELAALGPADAEELPSRDFSPMEVRP